MAEKQILTDDISPASKNGVNELIYIGKKSEKILIDYTNTLLTAMNPRTNVQEACVPNPHPCSLDQNQIKQEDKNEFYENIVNCCQRHQCRLENYCKSTNKKTCRFNYPMEICEATHIEFIEIGNSVRAQIFLKRNDTQMNVHNRIICQNWCANVDMQIILDQEAEIAYMVKYATKAEKAGSSLTDLYKTIILNAKEDDYTLTKLRSLMLKTVTGKRDLGQCEVNKKTKFIILYKLL